MARFYHGGMSHDSEKGIGGGIDKSSDPEKPGTIRVPPMFVGPGAPKEMPLKKGGVAFGFVGHGFWHLGPGEYVDLPDSLPVAIVKTHAPQLLTKAEAVAAGLCHEDGSPVHRDEPAARKAR